MTNEITVFSRTIKVARDNNNCVITLDIEIKHSDRERDTVNHSKIKGYEMLSISGMGKNPHRNDCDYAGQIYDEITPSNIKTYYIKRKTLNEILYIWREWHINDLRPNCEHQTAFDCNIDDYTERAKVETKKCPKGYAYGSAWLVEPLPRDIVSRIKILIERADKETV